MSFLGMFSERYLEYKKLISNKEYLKALLLAEEEHLRVSDGKVFWLVQQANALIKLKRISEAVAIAESALNVAPQNAWTLLTLAEAYRVNGDFARALELYEEVYLSLGSEPAAKFGLLRCLVDKKDWERLLEKLSQIELDEKEVLEYQLKAYSGLKDEAKVLLCVNRLLEICSEHRQALWEKTKIDIKREGMEGVLSKLARLVKIPSCALVYHELYAWVCKESGEMDKAISEYQRLVPSTSSALRQQAFALAKSGREQEAVPIMESLLSDNPSDVYVHSSYVAACTRISLQERAISFYSELLQKNPQQKNLYGCISRLRKSIK